MRHTILFLFVSISTFWACSSDSSSSSTEAVLATLTTTACTGTTTTVTSSGGVITSDGGAAITQRGVCWSTQHNPTTLDNKTIDGTGSGTFNSSITNLTPGTVYYIRAYAINSKGIAYGNEVSCTTEDTMYFPPNDGCTTWDT